MTLQAVVFDVDGTLAETERHGHRVAYNRAFTDEGAEWEWNESIYGDLLKIEGGRERLDHYLRDYQPDFSPPDGHQGFVSRAHASKNRHYRDMLQSGSIPLRPGILRLLRQLRDEHITLAIASSSMLGNVHALLQHMLDPDAANWFDVIVTGDDVARKKPATDIYERVLDRLELPTSACVAIEDSANGCQAAVRTGLTTIVTTSSYTSHHPFDGACLVADSLGDPDHPWTILAGPPLSGNPMYLDLDLLRKLHAMPRERIA